MGPLDVAHIAFDICAELRFMVDKAEATPPPRAQPRRFSARSQGCRVALCPGAPLRRLALATSREHEDRQFAANDALLDEGVHTM